MKTIILLIGQWISVIAAHVAFLWCIIEFILYLAKDKEFNWNSVWMFIISVVIFLICLILLLIIKVEDHIKKSHKYGGRFAKRMQEIRQNYKETKYKSL